MTVKLEVQANKTLRQSQRAWSPIARSLILCDVDWDARSLFAHVLDDGGCTARLRGAAFPGMIGGVALFCLSRIWKNAPCGLA
jgi:hypothetical protein